MCNEDKQRAVKAALAHPKAKGMSDRKIAEHCGVSFQTIANWRKSLPNFGSQPARTGADGRTINTANIGKRKEGLQRRDTGSDGFAAPRFLECLKCTAKVGASEGVG